MVVRLEIRIPAQPQIQVELTIHAPVILSITADPRAGKVFELPAALVERGCPTQHEVRHIVAGELAAEIESSVLKKRVEDVVGQSHNFATEMEFVPSFDQREILADRDVVPVKIRAMVGIDGETWCEQLNLRSRTYNRFRRACDLHTRLRIAKRCAGVRMVQHTRETKGAVDQERRRYRVCMV